MAITNGYCTLSELKAWNGVPDLVDDDALEMVINAVSRLIDKETRRRFWTTGSDETRYYTAMNALCVFTDDIISVTSVATDADGSGSFATAWVSTDYRLSPYNASADGLPYNEIQIARNGANSFPVIERGVMVIGRFGVPSASPWQAVVKGACLMQCARMFKRKDAPFGVAGSGELGQLIVLQPQLDPDVKKLLAAPITRLMN